MAVVITVAQQKGGAGKTTLAASLAAAYAGTRKVAVLDIDPQGSLANWHRLRAARTPAPALIALSDISGWRLAAELRALAGRAPGAEPPRASPPPGMPAVGEALAETVGGDAPAAGKPAGPAAGGQEEPATGDGGGEHAGGGARSVSRRPAEMATADTCNGAHGVSDAAGGPTPGAAGAAMSTDSPGAAAASPHAACQPPLSAASARADPGAASPGGATARRPLAEAQRQPSAPAVRPRPQAGGADEKPGRRLRSPVRTPRAPGTLGSPAAGVVAVRARGDALPHAAAKARAGTAAAGIIMAEYVVDFGAVPKGTGQVRACQHNIVLHPQPLVRHALAYEGRQLLPGACCRARWQAYHVMAIHLLTVTSNTRAPRAKGPQLLGGEYGRHGRRVRAGRPAASVLGLRPRPGPIHPAGRVGRRVTARRRGGGQPPGAHGARPPPDSSSCACARCTPNTRMHSPESVYRRSNCTEYRSSFRLRRHHAPPSSQASGHGSAPCLQRGNRSCGSCSAKQALARLQATAPIGELLHAAHLTPRGGLPLRVTLRANVVQPDVRLSTDALHFGSVRAGCCKVRGATFGPGSAYRLEFVSQRASATLQIAANMVQERGFCLGWACR